VFPRIDMEPSLVPELSWHSVCLFCDEQKPRFTGLWFQAGYDDFPQMIGDFAVVVSAYASPCPEQQSNHVYR
jgi:hypothetical protein